MKFGSVCSGIEAASIAWESLGFKALWFSEIEAFPSAVLSHHWPEVVNLGDMTKIAAAVRAGSVSAPMILVGGTPCQAFSLAGVRAGLSDPRGQLTISYGELADAIDQQRSADGEQPAIIVWENVPGVLSDKGNAFGAFLGLLAGEDCELQPTGKRWSNAGCVFGPQRTVAWRILDAQYFGVAQRRRRIFVVASARADFDPTKVLFESEGVRRDTAPSRSAGSVAAALTANGVRTCGADDNQAQAGHLVSAFGGGNRSGAIEVAACLTARGQRIDFEVETFLAQYSSTGQGAWSEGCGTLRAREQESHEHLAVMAVHGTQDPDTSVELAHTLGRNHGQENALISFSSKDNGQDASIEVSPTLRAGGHSGSHANAGAPPAVAYCLQHSQIGRNDSAGPQGKGYQVEIGFTLDSRSAADAVATDMSVRRLTPVECERLQGFPDNHTLIPVSKRKQITADEYAYLRNHFPNMTAEEAYRQAADGPRYKAIGNSMAVPVMHWIGKRILSQLS